MECVALDLDGRGEDVTSVKAGRVSAHQVEARMVSSPKSTRRRETSARGVRLAGEARRGDASGGGRRERPRRSRCATRVGAGVALRGRGVERNARYRLFKRFEGARPCRLPPVRNRKRMSGSQCFSAKRASPKLPERADRATRGIFVTDCLVARSRFAKKPHRVTVLAAALRRQKSATWPLRQV